MECRIIRVLLSNLGLYFLTQKVLSGGQIFSAICGPIWLKLCRGFGKLSFNLSQMSNPSIDNWENACPTLYLKAKNTNLKYKAKKWLKSENIRDTHSTPPPLLRSVSALHNLLHPALRAPHVHRRLHRQRQALPPPLRVAGEGGKMIRFPLLVTIHFLHDFQLFSKWFLEFALIIFRGKSSSGPSSDGMTGLSLNA